MNNSLKTVNIFLITCFLAISTVVFVHEGTHIALNEGRFESFCVGNCEMSNVGLLGNNYSPATITLSEPINPIALNEEIPTATGLAAGAIVFGYIGSSLNGGM